jgi:hypothetical protein
MLRLNQSRTAKQGSVRTSLQGAQTPGASFPPTAACLDVFLSLAYQASADNACGCISGKSEKKVADVRDIRCGGRGGVDCADG